MPKGLGYVKPLSFEQFKTLKNRGYDFYFAKVYNSTNDVNEIGIKNMENAEKAGLEVFPFVHTCVNYEVENNALVQVSTITERLKKADIPDYFSKNPILVFAVLSDEDQDWDLVDTDKNREFIWDLISNIQKKGFQPAIYTMRKYWLEIVGEWENPVVYKCPLFWPQYTALSNAYRTFRKFGQWDRPYAHHYAKNVNIYFEENGRKSRIMVYNIRLYKYDSTITIDPFIEMLTSIENMNSLLIDEKSYEFEVAWLDRLAILDTNVSKYYHELSSMPMAIKHVDIPIFNGQIQGTLEQMKKEIEIRMKVEPNPHIIDIFGLGCDIQNLSTELDKDRRLWVCMELMDFSLQQYIEKFPYEKTNVDERFLGYISVSIIQALQYLNKKKILHRNVNVKNILFNFGGQIKFATFDISGLTYNSEMHSNKSDTLSMAQILLQTISGKAETNDMAELLSACIESHLYTEIFKGAIRAHQ